MMDQYDVVIVGGGKAGSQLAASLRDEGFTGSIALIGDEAHLPYDRPPLSKAYLIGTEKPADLEMRAAVFYEDEGIDLVLDDAVSRIDRAGRQVELNSGRLIGYERLVLATGAALRPLPMPGAELTGVYGLKTIEDADALRMEYSSAQRIVVIGGGFIGLEAAAVAAMTFGLHVTVVEALPRLMARTTLPETANYVLSYLESISVEIVLGTGVTELRGAAGRVREVQLSDGRVLPADLVVYGIGVLPRVELAESAGIKVANGIVVDASLRTEDGRIWAIGDVAVHPNSFAGGMARLESVQNATDQARHVAKVMVRGEDVPYESVPWFWSDQGELRLQSAGITTGHDRTVVVGDPSVGAFSVLAFRHGAILGGDSIGSPADHVSLRRLLARADSSRLTPEVAEEPEFTLKGFARNLAQSVAN